MRLTTEWQAAQINGELYTDHLGRAIFDPMTIDGQEITIDLYDTGTTDSMGKSRLAYELREGDELVFAGTDYYASPLHLIDGPESFAGIAGFLSLRPGDTDADYFYSYTERQHRFADECGEDLACQVYDIEHGEQ